MLGTSILGGILTASYRAQLVVPAGVPADAAAAAHETLAGAVTAAGSLPARSGTPSAPRRRRPSTGGVVVTSLIGAALVVLAGVIAATTREGPAARRRADAPPERGSPMSRVISLAVIPGDGIGPEVIAEAEKVLDAVTAGSEVTFEKTRFALGADRYLATGDTLTDADLAAIARHDAILLGAVGGVPGDRGSRAPTSSAGCCSSSASSSTTMSTSGRRGSSPASGVRSRRPARSTSSSCGRARKAPTSGTAAVSASAPPRDRERGLGQHGLRRRARRALRLRARGASSQARDARAQDERARERGRPVEATRRCRGRRAPRRDRRLSPRRCGHDLPGHEPGRFDVIVTDNLFGDILTDLAGAISGGIGLAASGNINPDGTFPSMFEPVHGSAPTSPASRRRIRRRRSSRSPSCSTTWGFPTRRPA